MAYSITHFGKRSLPSLNGSTPIGAGGSRLSFQLLATGASVRLTEKGKAAPAEHIIRVRATLVADTLEEWEAATRALNALRGTEDRLWRRWLGSGTREWCHAELTDVQCVHEHNEKLEATYELTFYRKSASWFGKYHGAPVALSNGQVLGDDDPLGVIAELHALDASPKVFTVTNGDHTYTTVHNAIVTIKAGDADFTFVKVACGAAEWQYTGTIPAGQSLVVDVAEDTVELNGADAYANFAITVNHKLAPLLALLPGANQVTVTFTGGGAGATILVAFYEATE